jgi:hypothetical protein
VDNNLLGCAAMCRNVLGIHFELRMLKVDKHVLGCAGMCWDVLGCAGMCAHDC